MSYDKGKVEHNEEEPSGMKPNLFNAGFSIWPIVSSYITTLANYMPNSMLNEANTYSMGTSTGCRMNMSIANSSGFSRIE